MDPNDERRRKIRSMLRRKPEVLQSEISRVLGVSQATVSRSITELRAIKGAGGYYCPKSIDDWNEILDIIEQQNPREADLLSQAVFPQEEAEDVYEAQVAAARAKRARQAPQGIRVHADEDCSADIEEGAAEGSEGEPLGSETGGDTVPEAGWGVEDGRHQTGDLGEVPYGGGSAE